MNLNEYLESAETPWNKILFLAQLPFLFLFSRLRNQGIFTLSFLIPIKGKRHVLAFMWENPASFIPEWFRKMDFSSFSDKSFMDVGANLGLYAAYYTKQTGNESHCFEISEKHNQLLHACAEESNSNLTITGIGLSDKAGIMDVYSDNIFSMMSTLSAERYASKNFKSAGKATIGTLDEYMGSNPLLRVGLMKIDVEGLEEKVLAGGRRFLVNQKPCIIFEANREGDFEKCARLLRPLGYVFSTLDSINYLAISIPKKKKTR